jgi:phospholipid/cholesterol/gamma-HCH transport system substrate-binding protein
MSVILVLIIGLLTTQRLLKEEDIYYVAYSDVSVSGLEVGSPVKYLGIKVGVIRDIRIDPSDVNRIIVKLALKPGTPIKEDAVADINAVGITGLKTIEIRGGSNNASFLNEEAFIGQGSSLTEDITGKAEVIAEKMEVVLNNLQAFTQPTNMDKIVNMIDQISLLSNSAKSTIEKIDKVLEENVDDINTTIRNAGAISARLDTGSVLVMESIVRINNLVNSDTIDQILGSAKEVAVKLQESNLKGLIEEMGQVVKQTNQLLIKINRDVDQGSEDFIVSLELLKATLHNLEEVSRKINQDPSLLIRGSETKDLPDQNLKD